MALTRDEKVERVAHYVEQMKDSRGIILTNYQGLDVKQMQEIRNEMRPQDGDFEVIKNRLLALALQEVKVSLPDEWLNGPTAIGFCYGDVPPVAKVLNEARKETEILDLKGGWMDGAALSADQVKTIASLPSREVLLAQVLGAINGPARQTAGVVASGVRQVLNVLQAYVDKMEEGGGAAEPAPEAA